eukprot:jgi/Chlat1/4465/Chrsp29S04412
MSKSCKGLLDELVKCLADSDCVKVEGRTLKECAGRTEGVSQECQGLRTVYYECKRGQLDMRRRIRGNKGY